MMRFIRKLFLLICSALLLWWGIYTYNKMTDGFSIYQMTSSLPPYPQFEVPMEREKKEELQELLKQKFYYIGKGCQFYVFESEDGSCVIKFLKHKHLRPFTWLRKLPLPEKLRQSADAKIARREERVQRLFSSCKLAYEKMPEETGLIYIHLNRSPCLECQAILVDKLGFKHTVAVDKHEFVLQKKARSVKDVFTNLNEAEASSKIQQLIDLVMMRANKGICDRDRSFVQNVAFSQDGEKAVFIDIGQFYEDPAIIHTEEQSKDIKKRLGNLRHWMERNHPNYLHLIDQLSY